MNDGFDARMYFDKDEVIKNVLEKMGSKEIQSFIQSLRNDVNLQETVCQIPGGLDALANLYLPDRDIETGIIITRDKLIPEIERMLNDFPALIQQTLKIGCFSETGKSPSMWGLYSENETGFCLEFSFESSHSFAQSSNGSSRICDLYPVIYNPEKYKVASSYIEYLILFRLFFRYGLTIFKESEAVYLQQRINELLVCPDIFMTAKIALYKSMEWETEKEWRLFCNSDNDNAFRMASNGFFLKKPTALYLGRRISELNERILVGLAIEKEIPVYKMKLNDSSMSYDLTFDMIYLDSPDQKNIL